MKNYYYTIMSIDPDENPEDNHQKYGGVVEATDHWQAEAKAKEEFSTEHPGLPIYWVKISENSFGCL